MAFGIALVAIAMGQQLLIEKVRSISYVANDHRLPLRRIQGTTPVFFQSKLSCDVDGSPNAYHPLDDRLSLDVIDSAGGKREEGRPNGALLVQPSPEVVVWTNGKPYIQPEGEFKGFYVSETTLRNPKLPAIDPTSYLDARHTQYIVLPGGLVPEAKIGDLAIVYDLFSKTYAAAVYGDIGPSTESGEAAMATLRRLGMAVTDGKSSPAQLRDDLFFLVFPNTAARLQDAESWPYRQETIDMLATDELQKWGGTERIEAILKQDPQGGSVLDTDANSLTYGELAALKRDQLVRTFEFSLPVRFHAGPEGRLPCATEIVVAARAGVGAIEAKISSVELSEEPASNLNGMVSHLRALSQIFRRFPVETADLLEGVVREIARCYALEERIRTCGG